MRLALTIDQKELEDLILTHVRSRLDVTVVDKVVIYVRSAQNYRATWEECRVLVVNEEGRQDHNAAHPKGELPEIKAEVRAT